MKFTNEEPSALVEFADIPINDFFRDMGGNIYQKRSNMPNCKNAFCFKTDDVVDINHYAKVQQVELTEIKYRKKV